MREAYQLEKLKRIKLLVTLLNRTETLIVSMCQTICKRNVLLAIVK